MVRALLEGEQVIDLRKGGIREPGRQFDLASDRFFLYPTVEHQEPDLLKAAYRDWVDPAPVRRAGQIVIGGWADVIAHATIDDDAALATLDSKHIWTDAYAQSRLNWKARQPLWVLVLRVHRLLEPIAIPDRSEYHGCTSWMSLADMPADPYALPSEPVLSDTAFAGKLAGLPEWLPRD